jgi:hypothetical protein
VIKLPCGAVPERRHMKNATPPATTKIAAPMARASILLIPELSDGGVAFAGGGATVPSASAGTALVDIKAASSGDFTSLATAGAGVEVVVSDGGLVKAPLWPVPELSDGVTAFDVRGVAMILGWAGAGLVGVEVAGGGTAALPVPAGVPGAALVLGSSAKTITPPAARTMAQM